jgi:hypothetical protein
MIFDPRGKTPGNTYIFIRKYQEIPKKIRKYLVISENTCKFQKIQDQKHEILGNTSVFLRDSCSTWVFLLTGTIIIEKQQMYNFSMNNKI